MFSIRNTLYIPIDTNDTIRETHPTEILHLKRGADFLLILNGKENSRMLVDSYFTTFFYYTYAVQNNQIERNPAVETVNSGILRSDLLASEQKTGSAVTGETVDFRKFDTGALHTATPIRMRMIIPPSLTSARETAPSEIRIPWLLLSVSDPSSKQYWMIFIRKTHHNPHADQFWFGITSDNTNLHTNMASYSWEGWTPRPITNV
jgi:hypothetical protein